MHLYTEYARNSLEKQQGSEWLSNWTLKITGHSWETRELHDLAFVNFTIHLKQKKNTVFLVMLKNSQLFFLLYKLSKDDFIWTEISTEAFQTESENFI